MQPIRNTLAAVISILASCTCDTGACDEAKRAHGSEVDQGFAGVVAYQTDVCGNGCCACSFDSSDFAVWHTDALITTESDAATAASPKPDLMFSAKGRYSQRLDVGTYLVCLVPMSTGGFQCVPLDVSAGAGATVNVLKGNGGGSIDRVFNADGTTNSQLFRLQQVGS
jgi:hypothetical protein